LRHPGSRRHASQSGEECAPPFFFRSNLGGGNRAAAEARGRERAHAAGGGSEEDVCGAPAASNPVCGQDGLRGLERDVRFGLSGSGQGAGSGGGAPLCFALAGSSAFRGMDCGARDEACDCVFGSFLRFARSIADAMVAGFFDTVAGGFFDTRGKADEQTALGILGTRRKPFQDSPTPAGNSAAAIALLRLHGYANDLSYRDKAEQTLEVYAGVAGQHGIFAATYGLAVVRFIQPQTQVVVVGKDAAAMELYRTAVRPLGLSTAVLRLDADKVVAQNLPPALAETIPNLPQ